MQFFGGVAATTAAFFALTAAAAGQTFPEVNSYEDGTLVPPWQAIREPEPGRMSVTSSPTDRSHNVMRVELRAGDDTNGSARAEAVDRKGPDSVAAYPLWPDPILSERWYGWKTYLAPGFPSPAGTWTVVTQWHDTKRASPPFAIVVRNGRFELHRQGAPLTDWAAPATTGVWHAFVVNIRWAPPPLTGFVEVWHNGVRVVPRTEVPTMRWDDGVPLPTYFKQGIYRDRTISDTAILYHDTVRIGTTRAMVEP